MKLLNTYHKHFPFIFSPDTFCFNWNNITIEELYVRLMLACWLPLDYIAPARGRSESDVTAHILYVRMFHYNSDVPARRTTAELPQRRLCQSHLCLPPANKAILVRPFSRSHFLTASLSPNQLDPLLANDGYRGYGCWLLACYSRSLFWHDWPLKWSIHNNSSIRFLV